MRFQQYLNEKKKSKKKKSMSQGEMIAKARVPTVGLLRPKEVSKQDRIKKEKKKERRDIKKDLKKFY
jgi:hypothetical protein